ncbi:hypothetical protein RM531_08010 [Salinisphaera sp. P385]|uniref:Uncharacterized protein n=1 Tax=Spectribacter acetivorans TaxID=3075603 RepID=A0ABU3BAY1_9GAMM|nr:hypothetical protein [Salinisphaera sp. P385]MDT0618418.1 hypothetical protein [Salinisphaera sp. P385]
MDYPRFLIQFDQASVIRTPAGAFRNLAQLRLGGTFLSREIRFTTGTGRLGDHRVIQDDVPHYYRSYFEGIEIAGISTFDPQRVIFRLALGKVVGPTPDLCNLSLTRGTFWAGESLARIDSRIHPLADKPSRRNARRRAAGSLAQGWSDQAPSSGWFTL